jgi:hypothetical protein
MGHPSQQYRLNNDTGQYEWVEISKLEKSRRISGAVSSMVAMAMLFNAIFDIEEEDEELRIVPKKDGLLRVTFDGHPSYSKNKSIAHDYKEFSIQYRKSKDDPWETALTDYRVMPGIGHMLAPLGVIYEKHYLEDNEYIDKGVLLQKEDEFSNFAQLGSLVLTSGLSFSLSQGFVSGIETAQDLMEIALAAMDESEAGKMDYLWDKTRRTFIGQYTKPALVRYATQQGKAFNNMPYKDYSTLMEYIAKDNFLLEDMLNDVKIDGIGEVVYPEVDIAFAPSVINDGINRTVEDQRERSKIHELIMSKPEVAKPAPYYMRPLEGTGVKYLPKEMVDDIRRVTAINLGKTLNDSYERLKELPPEKLNEEMEKVRRSTTSLVKTMALKKYLTDNGVEIPTSVNDWRKLRGFIDDTGLYIKQVQGGVAIGTHNPMRKHITEDAQYNGMPTGEELDEMVSATFGAGNIRTQEQIEKLPAETQRIVGILKDAKLDVGNPKIDNYEQDSPDGIYYEIPSQKGLKMEVAAQEKFLNYIPKVEKMDKGILPHKLQKKVSGLHTKFINQEEAMYLIGILTKNNIVDKRRIGQFYTKQDDRNVIRNHPNIERVARLNRSGERESFRGLPSLTKVRNYMKSKGISIDADGNVIIAE